MSVESVREVFKKDDLEDLVLHSDVISDTVENAASLLGCEPKQIAKTMSFVIGDETVLIVTSGDAKIDNPKYKAKFNSKAKMASFEDVKRLTGHSHGGICPFGLK
ncbi:YbaK/EbsC family protein, partial [Peptoniphilus asaccharolyticus]